MDVQSEVINLVEANTAVEDYTLDDDTIKIWCGTRAHDEDKQALADDISSVEGVEVLDQGVENDWRVFLVETE